MVTAKTQCSLGNARTYFSEHLAVGDYYQQGQRIAGEWFGAGAKAIGLSGKIREDDFLALCQNQHPRTKACLTQRLNSVRKVEDKGAANRRIFYDFTFSPPKSVSIVGLVTGDSRVLEVHDRAVRAGLAEFETFAGTRVRKAGSNASRQTGNIAAALFTHDTSRALDPHLHTHCIVFNATCDATEGRWKALQNYEMLRARKYAEAVYYHELARDLSNLGYEVRNTARGDFELAGVAEGLCRRFSKRHQQIDESLDALLREKPELADSNLKDLREYLATAERSRKIKDQDPRQLRQWWTAQLTPLELASLQHLGKRAGITQDNTPRAVVAAQAVAWAEEHLFDRHSAVLEHEIWQKAIDHVRGSNVSAADLRRVTAARGYIRKHDQPCVVTLRSVLEREWEIVASAREGIGAFLPFVREAHDLGGALSDEQRVALKRLSGSRDFITLFQGGAGSGKSFVLRRLAEVIERAGHTVLVVAPQRQQVVGLESDGFKAPRTVSSFLTRNVMSKDAVVLVDEAGQVGGKQMLELVRMVAHHGGRLILSGDTRQHGPVEASDALLALERYAQLRPARLETIRRQDPTLGHSPHEKEQIRQYRDAVKAAASGQLAKSFEKLSRMGALVGCPLEDQQERLAQEFVLLSQQGLSSVVVAQTWPEVHRVNGRVREALKGRGLIQGEDQLITALERVDLTSAQKRDPRYNGSEQVVVLNRPVRGLAAGTQGKVRGVLKGGLLVEVGNRAMLIANRHLDRITVCQPLPIKVAPGDRLQIRANRQFADGSKITNGELVSVKSVARDGTIVLSDGRAMGADFREFLPGYAMTSYGSQGKTVDFVLFSDSAVRAATDRRQWYVTISRGRRGIRIFTPDKAQLQQNVIRSGDQPLALDLLTALHANTVRQKLALGGWARWLRPWSARARILLATVLCHHADQCSKRQVYERQTA